MDELKITQQAGVINTNLDAIEAEIREQMAEYKDYVVTEDSVKDDKKLLADLRKLEKELNDARIATKKEWNKPFDTFEQRCKEVIALVSEPIDLISSQIKMFDEEVKNLKLKHVKEVYDREIGEYEQYLPFDKIFNSKWLNKSYSDSDIIYDLSEMRLKVKNDLSAIESLGSEIQSEVIQTYISSGNDLSKAIARNSQFLADKAKIEQAKEAEKPVPIEEKNVEEPTPTNPEPQSESAMKSFTDFAEMVRTAKIIISYNDLEQVTEMLNFAQVKYQVEGE